LLGSDFTYIDLRMRLPTQGFQYSLAGQSRWLEYPVWVIEARPASSTMRQITSWALARYYLAQKFNFLLGADYFYQNREGGIAPSPRKSMRVNSLKQLDGVWTAEKITMFSDASQASILTLQDARFNRADMSTHIFSHRMLPLLAERIERGQVADIDSLLPQ
jgi:Outer membrane lipoprotein-sorting protein